MQSVPDRLPEPVRAVVVDASAAVEFLEGNDSWVMKWSGWIEDGAILLAPHNFSLEVANALMLSRGVAAAEARNRISRLFDAGVEPSNPNLTALFEVMALAERHRLTVYDAAYLQMALATDAELATLDRDLATAARREGVAVI
jgi:predicted nucleic acid-binding protein